MLNKWLKCLKILKLLKQFIERKLNNFIFNWKYYYENVRWEKDLHSNSLYFYDLDTSIIISSLQVRRIIRLKFLSDFEYDDDSDEWCEEEIDEKKELQN